MKDMGLYFVFGSVYSIYRYFRRESVVRLDHRCATCDNQWSLLQADVSRR